MTKHRKGHQILTATRTGVRVAYDLELNDQFESRRGAWAVIVAVALAFALILQMESEKFQAKAERSASSQISNVLTTS